MQEKSLSISPYNMPAASMPTPGTICATPGLFLYIPPAHQPLARKTPRKRQSRGSPDNTRVPRAFLRVLAAEMHFGRAIPRTPAGDHLRHDRGDRAHGPATGQGAVMQPIKDHGTPSRSHTGSSSPALKTLSSFSNTSRARTWHGRRGQFASSRASARACSGHPAPPWMTIFMRAVQFHRIQHAAGDCQIGQGMIHDRRVFRVQHGILPRMHAHAQAVCADEGPQGTQLRGEFIITPPQKGIHRMGGQRDDQLVNAEEAKSLAYIVLTDSCKSLRLAEINSRRRAGVACPTRTVREMERSGNPRHARHTRCDGSCPLHTRCKM